MFLKKGQKLMKNRWFGIFSFAVRGLIEVLMLYGFVNYFIEIIPIVWQQAEETGLNVQGVSVVTTVTSIVCVIAFYRVIDLILNFKLDENDISKTKQKGETQIEGSNIF